MTYTHINWKKNMWSYHTRTISLTRKTHFKDNFSAQIEFPFFSAKHTAFNIKNIKCIFVLSWKKIFITLKKKKKNKTNLKSNLKYFALISNVYNNNSFHEQQKKNKERASIHGIPSGVKEVGGVRTSTLICIKLCVEIHVRTKPVDFITNCVQWILKHTQREGERLTISYYFYNAYGTMS